jgi:predicted nucleotidyltransferase component of viral defense system
VDVMLDIEAIAEHRKYNGIRVNLIGVIKNTKTPFSIDFGVGDVIVPAPAKRELPVILPEFEKPEVLTYSFESIIAEKFDAIISRMELTGRMKDFYDIYYLASTSDFEGRKVQEAIFETLQNRGTPYEKDTLIKVAHLSEDKDIMKRWNIFCRKTLGIDLSFTEVMELLLKFLIPPYIAIITESESLLEWRADVKEYAK